MGLAVDAADESEPAGVEAKTAAAGCAFSSRSATRFSSCSTLSSSLRSRSVNGAGASILAAAGPVGGLSLPSSSPNAIARTALPQHSPTNITGTNLFHLKVRILLSLLLFPGFIELTTLSYTIRSDSLHLGPQTRDRSLMPEARCDLRVKL